MAHGFSHQTGYGADIRIYDVDPEKSNNSLEETVNKSDFIFLSVPTPADKDGFNDLSIVKSVLKDIDKVNGQLDSISLMNRIPDDLKEIVGTEIAIATGFGLSSYTHQEFFPNSNKTMFELGGMVIGGFSG